MWVKIMAPTGANILTPNTPPGCFFAGARGRPQKLSGGVGVIRGARILVFLLGVRGDGAPQNKAGRQPPERGGGGRDPPRT